MRDTRVGTFIRAGFIFCCLVLPLAAEAQTSTVNFGTTYQTIRGFGASTAWTAPLTTAQADAVWGTSGRELGLSINRARIDPGGSGNWGAELANAQEAVARGAIEFATPWSPPASMKTNGNVVGGSLDPTYYAAYANYLESFVNYMASGGVNLYAISMQNEPDFVPNYEGCGWTAQQMDTWVANNSSVLTTRLMMPESASFNFNQSDATLNDPNAVGHVSIIAGHLYGANISYYANAENHGKEVWATEHYLTPSGASAAIGDAIAAATEVHTAMTVGSYNAYVWWWIAQNSGNANINTGLVDVSGNPTYYGYAIGQFSRFVRPGAVRVSATSPSSGVYISAYKGSANGTIVAINSNANPVSMTFALQGLSPSSAIPYQTTSAGGLMQQSPVNVSNGSFAYTLPAQSIVSFVTSGSGASCASAPSAPGSLLASAASTSNINLSWTGVTPPANCSISSYTVYRSTVSGFTPSASNQVGTASGTSFSDSGLSAATTYYYVVEAADGAGSSGPSSQASATTQSVGGSCTSVPGAPSGLSAAATSSGSINLSWNAVTPPANCSISSYSVYRSTTSGFTPSSSNRVGTASGTSFANSGLTASTTYYYLVEAVDGAGSSAASSQASATTQASSGRINTRAWYHITTTFNGAGLCLDDAYGSTANGAVLQQYTCGNGQYNQEWQFRPAAANRYYSVVNRYASSLVWDDTGGSTANGNKIQLYTYTSGNANQEWQAVSLGNNLWKFVNLASGLCLDSTTSTNSAVQLQQYQCVSGDSAQVFQLTPVP
jgi:glucuronoarabinoxylan endo-1,4-beta-xylanase